MPSSVHINSGWLLGTIISIVFVVLYPLIVATVIRLRLKVKWRFFFYGALIFLLFQLITRVPLVVWLQGLLSKQLQSSLGLTIAWAFVLALTAGLCEEIGRYIGYRWLVKRENWTWRVALMYGAGHGGLESIVLIGGQLVIALINVLVFTSINLNTLPTQTHVLVVQQIAAINAQPAWLSLVPAWERLWTIPTHIGLSVIVLQVFRRRNIAWLYLAIAAHTVVDFLSVLLPSVLGSSLTTTLLVEGIVALAGLLGLWVIWRLRDQPQAVPTLATVSDTTIDTGNVEQ